MTIKLENTQIISACIAIRSTLSIIRDLLKEIPKKDRRYNELTNVSTDLTCVLNKIKSNM